MLDEAQWVEIKIASLAVDAAGVTHAEGTEHYRVAQSAYSVPVAIEFDSKTGDFRMHETDPERSWERDEALDSSFTGSISADMRSMTVQPGGCLPELSLVADAKSEPLLQPQD